MYCACTEGEVCGAVLNSSVQCRVWSPAAFINTVSSMALNSIKPQSDVFFLLHSLPVGCELPSTSEFVAVTFLSTRGVKAEKQMKEYKLTCCFGFDFSVPPSRQQHQAVILQCFYCNLQQQVPAAKLSQNCAASNIQHPLIDPMLEK